MKKPQARDSEQEVKVAKISAVQAIIVAFITAIAGIAGGFVASGGLKSTSVQEKPKWLIIKGVENLNTIDSEEQVRIIVNVNGYSFSYPSRTLFAVIGPRMSEERFPVITDNEGYRISFAAVISAYSLENQQGITELKEQLSQQIEIITPNQIPTGIKFYDLYPVYSGSRGMDPKLRVKYIIE